MWVNVWGRTWTKPHLKSTDFISRAVRKWQTELTPCSQSHLRAWLCITPQITFICDAAKGVKVRHQTLVKHWLYSGHAGGSFRILIWIRRVLQRNLMKALNPTMLQTYWSLHIHHISASRLLRGDSVNWDALIRTVFAASPFLLWCYHKLFVSS